MMKTRICCKVGVFVIGVKQYDNNVNFNCRKLSTFRWHDDVCEAQTLVNCYQTEFILHGISF